MATPLKDERPPLTLVKSLPEPAPLVVEKRPRPGWIMSAEELKRRARYAFDNTVDKIRFEVQRSPYYLGWSVRGYRRLCRKWWEVREDAYRQHIATAKHELRKAKGNMAYEAKARAVLEVRRAEYKLHKKKVWILTGMCGLALSIGTTVGLVLGSWWVQLLIAVAYFATGVYFGRPEEPKTLPVEAPTRTSHLGEEDMRRVLVEAGVVPEKRREEIRGVGVPHRDGPGIAYAVDLPSGISASAALGKDTQKKIASALAVQTDWMLLEHDRSAGSSESRLKIWVSTEDPFGSARRSPLLDHEGPTNTFIDGIPVAFDRRANTITLWIRDTSYVVAGATRRGKGMLLANILIGVMKDPWVNVRIFDGKGTAEHNAYAPMLSTFVKRNPKRLALILRAIVAELGRRADLLEDHGYEKIDDDNYDEVMRILGGREVFIVDELATYTPKNTNPYNEEITENLSQVAALGAALGVTLISLTQAPEVAVIDGRLRLNHVGRAAMKTESGSASNTILGDGMTGQGYDASKIPIDQPGRFWISTPETGVIEGRSYLVTPEDKRRVAEEAHEIRKGAGRLPEQQQDAIEAYLVKHTGVSSAAGGEGGRGHIVHFDFLEWLEEVAESTGRKNVTNMEIFADLAAMRPANYGRRDGESEESWTARIGKLVRDLAANSGASLPIKRVPAEDGKRAQGYLLDDITKARNSRN